MYFCALIQSLNLNISTPQRIPFDCLYLFLYILGAGWTFTLCLYSSHSVELCPWLGPSDVVKERRILQTGVIMTPGPVLKAGSRAGTNSDQFYSRLCAAANVSCKQETLHISFILFQAPLVIKTEVCDSEKRRFWSSSKKQGINAYDHQK